MCAALNHDPRSDLIYFYLLKDFYKNNQVVAKGNFTDSLGNKTLINLTFISLKTWQLIIHLAAKKPTVL